MYVVKRNGRKETVKFDKITHRIFKLCYGLHESISAEKIAVQVIAKMYTGITTAELDLIAAETAFVESIQHPDYALLASRLMASNIQKQTKNTFSECIEEMYNCPSIFINEQNAELAEDLYDIVRKNRTYFDNAIVQERDFHYDYRQLSAFIEHFMIKGTHHILERPQYMFMRAAIGIHKYDLKHIVPTYHALSTGKLVLNDVTLRTVGTHHPQMMPHFFTSTKKGELVDMHEVAKLYAKTSPSTATMSVALHESEQKIDALTDMLNTSIKYVQEQTKVASKVSVYLEPWHHDIERFLAYIQQQERYQNVHFALWMPDLFFKRLQENANWTLISPKKHPDLSHCHNIEFERLYHHYEQHGKGEKTIKAGELWCKIIALQLTTGMPHIVFKDRSNIKYNQQNSHVIRCADVDSGSMIGQAANEVSTCITAAIALPKMVNEKGQFDYRSLFETVYLSTINMNKIIDTNHYPDTTSMRFNLAHRPVGLGVHGLAETYIFMGIPFESAEAKRVNQSIFETIYFATLSASNDLAKIDGAYSSFPESMLSKGRFQFDLWDLSYEKHWNWDELREQIIKYGVRNSVLVAISSENFSRQKGAYSQGSTTRHTNVFQYNDAQKQHPMIIDPILSRHLINHNLWTSEIRKKIVENRGFLENFIEIDSKTKELFKTTVEMKQETLIDRASERGVYICQSQVLELAISDKNEQQLSALQLYAWQKGLKTGVLFI